MPELEKLIDWNNSFGSYQIKLCNKTKKFANFLLEIALAPAPSTWLVVRGGTFKSSPGTYTYFLFKWSKVPLHRLVKIEHFDARPKMWTLKNVFPHFMHYSTKTFLVYRGFRLLRFFLSPENPRWVRTSCIIYYSVTTVHRKLSSNFSLWLYVSSS